MLIKEHLYFDMSVEFDTFLKNNLETIKILSSAGIFLNDVNWRHCELPRSSFYYRFTHFWIMSINKLFYLRFCSISHSDAPYCA